MKVARHTVAQIVTDQTLLAYDPKLLARGIAAYLLAERRTGELDSLIRDVRANRAELGLIEVQVMSAQPLSVSASQAITSQTRQLFPAAKQIILTAHREESVIGGVRLEFANQQLDMSVRAKLSQFKQLTTAGRN